MFLHRIHLNLRSKTVRRDIADPYQMHATLCRAFSSKDKKCNPGTFLWRLEPETGLRGIPKILIQSSKTANWSDFSDKQWLFHKPDPAIDLSFKLGFEHIQTGYKYRFRLKGNPSVKRMGKRLGLFNKEKQRQWLVKKSELHGFHILSQIITSPCMLRGKSNKGSSIRVFSVIYDGLLEVQEPEKFIDAIKKGIGHGKAMGLGLLTVFPVS